MIERYIRELDDFILAADEIVDWEIIRRTMWDTELEKIGLYRYKIHFFDGSFLELTERLIEEKNTINITKYRYHWQDKDGNLIKRWDNAKHHPEIETFPHHLHEKSEENVIGHKEISGLDVLKLVISSYGSIYK